MPQLTDAQLIAHLTKEWSGFNAFGTDAGNVGAAATAVYLIRNGERSKADQALIAQFGEENTPAACDDCGTEEFKYKLCTAFPYDGSFVCQSCRYKRDEAANLSEVDTLMEQVKTASYDETQAIAQRLRNVANVSWVSNGRLTVEGHKITHRSHTHLYNALVKACGF